MLEGKCVCLRGYRLTDVASVIECLDDYEALKCYFGTSPLPPPMDIEKLLRGNDSNRSQEFDWVIEGKADQTFFGWCGYDKVDWINPVARVNIFLAKAFRGSGFGFEAMQILIDYMFTQMNLQRIETTMFDFNRKSMHLCEKLGFTQEGRSRQRIFRDGAYHDEVLMGLLRNCEISPN